MTPPDKPPAFSDISSEPPRSGRTDDFVAPPLRARHVYLRPITPSDYAVLQMLETAGDAAPRWRHRGVTPTPEAWTQTLWSAVLVQFLVVGVETDNWLGRVVLYQPNFQDRHAYFAAVRFEPRRPTPLMVLGVSLFLRYVFTYWDFEKLYMEVPEYNLDQFASGLDRFFVIEGRLRGHLRMGDQRWDQLILALYRDAAIKEGARLQLALGERTVFASEPAAESVDSDGLEAASSGSDLSQRSRGEIRWEQFAADVARIAAVSPEHVQPETRVLEDLALDSLALAELGVVLVDKYDIWSLSKNLETRSWHQVTVRQLFEEYLTGSPAGPADSSRG